MTKIFIDKDMTKTADDLVSLAQCDEALIWLNNQIAGIETCGRDDHQTRLALRMRRLGIQRVNERRAELRGRRIAA